MIFFLSAYEFIDLLFTAHQHFVVYLKLKHTLDCKNNSFFASEYCINNLFGE